MILCGTTINVQLYNFCCTHINYYPLFFCSDGCLHAECLKYCLCISPFTSCYFHAQFNPVLLKIATIAVQNLFCIFLFSQFLQNSTRYSINFIFCIFFFPSTQTVPVAQSVAVYSLIDVELYRDLCTRLTSCSLHSVVCKAFSREGFSNIPTDYLLSNITFTKKCLPQLIQNYVFQILTNPSLRNFFPQGFKFLCVFQMRLISITFQHSWHTIYSPCSLY